MVLICFVLLNVGCGFHLRGIMDKPEWLNDVVIIVHEAHPDLAIRLKEQLEGFHTKVISNPTLARYKIIIEKRYHGRIILQVSVLAPPQDNMNLSTCIF